MTKIKFGMLVATLLVVCDSMPNFAFAAIIVSNTSDSSVRATDGSFDFQSLGAGLSGTPTFIVFYASSTVGASETIGGGALISCPTSDYSTACYTYATGASVAGPVTKDLVTITLTATTSMNSAYYYYYDGGSAANYRVYGSSGSTYANGRYCVNGLGAAESCTFPDSTLTGDAYFILGNNPSYQNEGITAITNPTYAEVEASGNNVNFAFTYYINSLSYDKAGFALVDNSSNQSVNVSTLENTISASGSSNYSEYFDLITGHNYTWTPYLRNSSTGNYLYGTSTFFFTGSNSSTLPPAPPPVWSGCNNLFQPGCNVSTSTGLLTWNGGTSTTPLFGDTTLDQLLARKAPFSYLYDLKQVLFELSNGTSSTAYSAACTNSDAYYTLPYGKTLSSGSSTVKFIDACAISQLSVVVQVKELVRHALYLITGIGMAGMALSLL